MCYGYGPVCDVFLLMVEEGWGENEWPDGSDLGDCMVGRLELMLPLCCSVVL